MITTLVAVAAAMVILLAVLGVATLLAGLMRASHRTSEWERVLWGEDDRDLHR